MRTLMEHLLRVGVGTVAALSGLAAVQAGPPDPSAGTLVLRRCLVEYERNTQIGSPVYSVLEECHVEPGAVVKAGQVLGRLQMATFKAEFALREAEANNVADVKLTEARSAKAQARLQRTAALVARHAASQEEYLEQKLEASAAALEIEQARHRRQLAALQLDQVRASIRERELVSPHDGVVTAVIRRRGEAVAARDAVFQVVDPSELRVVGLLDVTDAWRLKVGSPVRVIPEIAGADLPIEHEVFPGRIVFIDTQIDPHTRTCKLHVRADSRGGRLRAGIEARMEIDPGAESPPTVAPGRPPITSAGEAAGGGL
ncbi:MAG: efflux RND transporter periplasmic adaptor subunit [Isosphaeraceae bacterium]